MTSYFLVNTFHFAFGVIGAIILILMAWLSFDAYKLQKNNYVIVRFLGFIFFALWQIIRSVNVGSDVLSYLGFIVFIVGLIFILLSFFENKNLVANAVIILPAFTLFSTSLYTISAILLSSIAYLSYRKYKKEYNNTWVAFALGFILLAVSYIISIFSKNADQVSFIYITTIIIELLGFGVLGYWVWQYMRLRIRESFVMIAVGGTFILATIITLAFSTILISRVATETSGNLLSDVKVLSFSIDNMKEEALAKADIVSSNVDLINAIDKNDMVALEKTAETLLEKYQLGFLTIADSSGSVLLRAHALSSRGDSIFGERVYEEAILGNTTVTIDDSNVEGFSVRAGSPVILKGKVSAVVVVGSQLDNAFTDKLQKLTGLQTFIYSGATSIASSALDSDGRTRLVGESLNDQTIKQSVLTDGSIATGSSKIFNTLFYSGYAPLSNSDDKIVGMISVSKPQQDIVNIEDATNRLTLITVTLIIIIISLPIYFVSKRYTEND